MKQCPFCKAEIEENARFCLYCMKPLIQKDTVKLPKKRQWIWVLVAVVLVVCIGLALLSMGERKPKETKTPHPTVSVKPNTQPSEASADEGTSAGEKPKEDNPSVEMPEENIPSSEPTEDDNPPAQTPDEDRPTAEPSEENVLSTNPHKEDNLPAQTPGEDQPSTEIPQQESPKEDTPTPCVHNYILTDLREPTCTTQGFQIYTCSLCCDSYQQTVDALGHQYTAPTCKIPKICKVCSQADGQPLGHSYSDGYCIRCKVPDHTNPKVVFSYREVAPGDYFPPDSVTEGSVVITGVKEVSPDGEYGVPDYIDGKPVVGIMSLAFSGSDARRVTLGKNILRVNQNAFAGCFDIEVLCIKSKALFLSRSAFIDAAHRSCKLTIYCAADCVVDDDLYGDCYLKDIVRVYGAEYQEL